MKKILILAIAAISLTSCNFLEVEKIGKSDIETYFSEVNALEPAVNGLYHLMYSFYDRYFITYGEIAGDLVNLSASNTDWDRLFNYETECITSDEVSAAGYIWKSGYEIISNTNYLIYYAPKLKDSYPGYDALIDNMTAQGYFVRGLITLNLCLVYAQTYTWSPDASHLGVALLTRIPSMNDEVKRSTVKQVYDQVIQDIETAQRLFEGSSYQTKTPYFAGVDACKALLARIYLYMHDYAKAKAYAEAVMEKYPLTPHDKYVNMFCQATGYTSEEAILRLNGYDKSGSLQTFYKYDNAQGFPSGKLLEMFDSDDIREALQHYTVDVDGKTTHFSNINMKFYCTEQIADKDKHYDPFVLRSSEMYLIHAEACCQEGALPEAEKDLKALIARAYGKTPAEITLTYSGKEGLDALIMRERMKELCFEGHRFFDIARRHESVSRDSGSNARAKTLSYPDYRFALPIPRVEMDANPAMEQNDEY